MSGECFKDGICKEKKEKEKKNKKVSQLDRILEHSLL